MEQKTYKKPSMRVLALHQKNHLLGSSDPAVNPTNEVNATRDNYVGGAAWQWS